MEKNDKFKVLFLTEKWCDGNPDLGLSNNYHNLFGSLKSSGLGVKFNMVHYDEFYARYHRHIDDVLLSIYDQTKPDLIITSFLGTSWLNPSARIYEFLKDRGVTLCFMWPDTGYDWAISKINKIGNVADLHVSWGSDYREHDRMDKHLWLWAPQNEKLFYNKKEKRITASFIGSLRGYKDRPTYVNYALKKHKNLLVLGGQREGRLTPEEYSSYIRDSQIGVNFPESPSGIDQCKGRVIEIISCGSMLLEKKNEATKKILTPGKDYVEFDGLEDFIQKIEYYQNNHKERDRIAESGYKKYCDNFSSLKFWEKVLTRCNYEL